MFGGLDSSGRYEQEATEFRGCRKERDSRKERDRRKERDSPKGSFLWKDGKKQKGRTGQEPEKGGKDSRKRTGEQ